jgi:hypothetical protein
MTPFEKWMYGDLDPNNPQDMTRAPQDIRGQIRRNLLDRGKSLLANLHHRFLLISTDVDLRRNGD